MLSYNFIRGCDLNPIEFRILMIIDSFSGESHLKVGQYAEMIGRSARTVRRALKTLKDRGYVRCRYGVWKSLHLSVHEGAQILHKLNARIKKPFSYRPSKSVKTAKKVPFNIERNKEKIYSSQNGFQGEQIAHPGGKTPPIPTEFSNLWNKLLGKSV